MKVAVCIGADARTAVAACGRMATAMCLEPDHEVTLLPVHGGAVAVVTSARLDPARGRVALSPDGRFALSTGVPLAERGAPGVLAGCLSRDFSGALQQLTAMEGAHASLYWDHRERRLGIVTDILGMQPLYIATVSGSCLLATELKAFGASGMCDVAPDPAGWGAFLAFGHAIADGTMLRGISRVAPATVLVLEPDERIPSSRSYWSLPAPAARTPSRPDTEELLRPLREDVQRYLEYDRGATLLLSGGLDSRLLLALILEAGATPPALALSHADELRGADGRFARALARRLQLDLTLVDTPPGFYQSADFLRYVNRNECSTQSLYLFIAQVAHHIPGITRAVWEGVFPEVALRPPSSFVGDRRVRGAGPGQGLWAGAEIVFQAEFLEEVRQRYGEALGAERAHCADLGIAEKAFFIRNRTRHRTATNPLAVYANDAMPFTPGLNRHLFEIDMSSFPGGSKHGLYLDILRQHYPGMMAVPVVSGGRLVRRGNLDLQYLGESALERWSAGLRRVRESRLGPVLGLSSSGRWQTTGTIDRVIARASSFGVLDEAAMDRVRTSSSRNGAVAQARHLLFYWTVWNWIMRGELDDELVAELTQAGALPAPPQSLHPHAQGL